MPINLGLLSERSLANQPEEVRQGLQEQATRQFLLNALMGGGLRGGFAASQAVPEQYQTQVEQRALDRAVAQAKERATRPQGIGLTQTGEGSQFDMLQAQNEGFDQGQMQGVNAATAQALQSNRNIPRQLDVAEYARQIPSILAQAGPRAKIGSLEKTLSTALQVAPQITDGVIRDPVSGQIVGFAPKRDLERGVQVINDVATPIQGFRGARIASTVPTFGPNIEPVLGPRGELSVRPIAGATQAVAQLEGATTGAREANIPRPMTTPSGAQEFRFVTPPAMFPQQPAGAVPPAGAIPVTGAPTAPVAGAAQTTANRPQTAFDITRQKGFDRAYEKAQISADMASSQNPILDQLQLGLNQFPTGRFAEQKAAVTSVLEGLGVTGDRAKNMLTGYTSLRTGLADLTANNIQDLSGATSDKDIVFTKSRMAQITDTKEAMQFAIDLKRAINRRSAQKFEYFNQNPGPDAESNWRKSGGAMSVFSDPNMLKYLPQARIPRGPDAGKIAYQLPNGKVIVQDN